MYYPYLRGKQFELILVRDRAPFLKANRIHPIIEPVRVDFSPLSRAVKALKEANASATFVINPRVGDNPVPIKSMFPLIDGEIGGESNFSIGYILTTESNINELLELLNKYHNNDFSIIHYGYSEWNNLLTNTSGFPNIKRHVFIDGYAGKLYQKRFKKENVDRILIRDGFRQQKRNSDYPQSEHFSELHMTYKDEGMNGFGDFLTVGDDFSETGGPAFAVVIHLTYLNLEDDMFIYHFLSDKIDSPVDPGGKFLEALQKLNANLENPDSLIFNSNACDEFRNLNERKHYPGLGYLKKLSMQHHIELIADYLRRSN